MATRNEAINLLNRQTVVAGQVGKVVDLADYNAIHYQIRVHEAGPAGTIDLEHAAVDEDLAYASLGIDASLSVAAEAGTIGVSESFLRYVRYKVSSSIGSPPPLPVVSIDIVAKKT
jgi:hypothetical protein